MAGWDFLRSAADRGQKAHKPEAQAKDCPSLALQACVRTVRRWTCDRGYGETIAVVFVALLLSALATELIGVHAIFGAFLLGAVVPHDSAVARAFTHQLEDL